jgi:hypothetical protein
MRANHVPLRLQQYTQANLSAFDGLHSNGEHERREGQGTDGKSCRNILRWLEEEG